MPTKFAQTNTHESADTDTATTALHHTLGTGANQAAPGNHSHTAADVGLGNVANATQQFLHGFPNRTATTIAFDNSSHVFTLGVSTAATIYIGGAPYTIASPGLTVDLDDKTLSAGLWFIWAEVSGGAAVLNASKTAWSVTNTAAIPVATVYWNGAAGALCDERHAAGRNLETHAWQHATVGARIPNDGSFVQTYPSAAQSKLELGAGYLWDEDIQNQITAAQGRLVRNWYESSLGVWTFTDGTDNGGNDRPYIWNGSTSRVRFPKSDASYALTDVAANSYMAVFVYASNDVMRPVYIVTPAGTSTSMTITQARLINSPVLPFAPETKLLYRWIFRGDGLYQEAVDYRGSATLPGGGTTSPAAISVSFAPIGGIAATNVQAAIEELDAEKLSATGGTLGDYSQTGVADLSSYYAAGTLTIPWGTIGVYTLTANTTLAFSGAPTAPTTKVCELIIKQPASGGTYTYTLSYPSARWPYTIIQAMPTGAGAELDILASIGPDGLLRLSAMQYGAGA